MKMQTSKNEGFTLGYQLNRRRLAVAIALTLLLYIAGYYLAQHWTLYSFDLTQFALTPTRPFHIQNLGKEIKPHSPPLTVSSPQTTASPDFKSFNPPPSVSIPPSPSFSPESSTLNQTPTLASQLPSSELAAHTAPSFNQSVSSITPTNSSASIFNLPSTTPTRTAEETLPTSTEPLGNELGNNLGNPSGFSDVGQLLNSDLRDQLASPEGVVVRLSNEILFDFDSYQLQPTATPVLTQVAQLIQKYPQAQISIEGHADTFGDNTYNQQLSEQRAQAVHDWLRQNSSLSTPVQVIGYGEQKPLANPQGTIEEQQINRRVEIRLRTINQ